MSHVDMKTPSGNQRLAVTLAWTAGLAQREMKISAAVERMPGVKGKELWITGAVDPIAQGALEKRGWKVYDRAQDKILKR